MVVVLESPYAGSAAQDTHTHVEYARRALRDSLDRGESPVASHLLYTQTLDDRVPEERSRGIAAGLVFYAVAKQSVVYIDYGISPGMVKGMQAADEAGIWVEYRSIGTNPPGGEE